MSVEHTAVVMRTATDHRISRGGSVHRSTMDVLVLGHRGAVGRHVVDALGARGHAVRTLGRRTGDVVGDLRDPDVVARAAAGAGAIVNCAGASVALGLGKGWRGYRAVDVPIGLATIEAARRTDARVVYVGAFHVPALRRCADVDAHERVVDAMRDIDGVVVRATGFYSAFAALVPLARRGVLVDIGNGRARTNPIAEADLAQVIADAVTGDGPREIAAGGPEVMTRRELFEQVAASVERRVRIFAAPVWLAGVGAAMLRCAHPRIGQFARFATLLAKFDNIAPAVGTIRLAEYLAGITACRRDILMESAASG
jgi:uncharacterized protein YbjT (DUF2867 family)